MRSLMTSGALVLLAPLLSGCVGLLIDMPSNENIQSPVPRKGSRLFGVTDNRWACQWAPDATPSAKKHDYLGAWGEPTKKSATDKGETWSYGEDWRWCGFWIFAVVPIPFMLPVCGAGIAFIPNPVTLVWPVPFTIEPGLATHGKPQEVLPVGPEFLSRGSHGSRPTFSVSACR